MASPPVTVGFWPRLWAFVVDTACLSVVLLPLGLLVYQLAFGGTILDLLVNGVLPFAIVFWFWRRWLATPGKMLIPAEIVDSRSLAPPSSAQLLIRYLGYFVSVLPLGLGMFWILWDPRNQAWHDKLAHTLVIRSEVNFFRPGTRRILHLISALLALGLLAGCGAGLLWAIQSGPGLRAGFRELQSAVENGNLQGVIGTTDSCWDGAWNLDASCSGLFCPLQGSFFLRSCLQNCRPTPDTCLRILPGEELSVSLWQARCQELDRPAMGCVLLMGTLAMHCRSIRNQP